MTVTVTWTLPVYLLSVFRTLVHNGDHSSSTTGNMVSTTQCGVQNNQTLYTAPSQNDLVYILTSHYFGIHFNIILLFKLKYCQVVFCFSSYLLGYFSISLRNIALTAFISGSYHLIILVETNCMLALQCRSRCIVRIFNSPCTIGRECI